MIKAFPQFRTVVSVIYLYEREMEEKIYGFLCKSERGEFMYCCSDCKEMYKCGFELERHISFVHQQEDIKTKNELANEFVVVESIAKDRVVKEERSPDENANCSDADTAVDTDNDDLGKIGNHNDDDVVDDVHDEIVDSENKSRIRTCYPGHPSSLECEICRAIFKSRRTIEKHMELRHSHKKELCSVCGVEADNMKVHMRSHNKKPKKDRFYTCKVCKAQFRHSSYLNIHIRVHTGETPYMCYICGRTFISQGKLTHHTKRHSDVKEHKCDQCDRAYHERFQLKRHINIVHKGIRLFSCTICDTNKFTTKKSLGQHMLLHGEKRFPCKFCGQKFAQGSGRRGHEKRVHGAL